MSERAKKRESERSIKSPNLGGINRPPCPKKPYRKFSVPNRGRIGVSGSHRLNSSVPYCSWGATRHDIQWLVASRRPGVLPQLRRHRLRSPSSNAPTNGIKHTSRLVSATRRISKLWLKGLSGSGASGPKSNEIKGLPGPTGRFTDVPRFARIIGKDAFDADADTELARKMGPSYGRAGGVGGTL